MAAPGAQSSRNGRDGEAGGTLLSNQHTELRLDLLPTLTVALSRVFMIFSTSGAGPVTKPSLAPGATIFEKLSTRMTRPSMSIDKNVGTIGLSAPLGRIWRKQSSH